MKNILAHRTRTFGKKILRTNHFYVCVLLLLNYALNQETFKNHVGILFATYFLMCMCYQSIIADVHLMVNTCLLGNANVNHAKNNKTNIICLKLFEETKIIILSVILV